MELKYFDEFTKTHIEDMEAVQKVVKLSGSIIDTKLFPLIDEAEMGDLVAMAELWEMFVYSYNNVTPSYEGAKYYWDKIAEENREETNPIILSSRLNTKTFMLAKFEDDDEKYAEVLMEAFKYMVANVPVERWNNEIFSMMQNSLPYFQEEEEEAQEEEASD